MNPVSVNGTAPSKAPPILLETPVPIFTDNTTVDGSIYRNYINTKWQAKWGFTYLTPAEVQWFNTLCLGGATVTYENTMSAMVESGTLTFTALPTFEFDQYLRGANMLVPYTVTFRQV